MAADGKIGRDVFDPKKIYNVTEEEMRAMQDRAKIREAMKKEFQQKVSNPYRGVGGYIVSDLDPLGRMSINTPLKAVLNAVLSTPTLSAGFLLVPGTQPQQN